jgi:leucyl-tRNA synthetase
VEGYIKNGKFFDKDNLNEDQLGSNLNIKKFWRETNTMPNWAGSCWYYLRYLDPNNTNKILGEEEQYWSENKYATVDLYIGGSEHAVLHLLYARFWHMFLFDRGYIPNPEPFQRLIHQGMITADAFTDKNNHYVDTKEVEVKYEDGKRVAYHKNSGENLNIVYGKMGKSYKNGVLPEEVVNEYGIDIFRMHLMYMGPITQAKEWNTDSILGMQRFCRKVQKLHEKMIVDTKQNLTGVFDKLIKSVTEHYQNLNYNLVIASLIKYINEVDSLTKQQYQDYLVLLSPIAPHLSEYLHNKFLNYKTSIFELNWPEYNSDIIAQQLIKVPVTQNGKLRMVLEVSPDVNEEELIRGVKDKFKNNSGIRIFWKNNQPVTITIQS